MKTTLDLPEDLLVEAKAVAARRRITLKAMVEHALRRELSPAQEGDSPGSDQFEVGELGFLVLKSKGRSVSADLVSELIDEADDEDFHAALRCAGMTEEV